MTKAHTLKEIIEAWIALQYVWSVESDREVYFWAYGEIYDLVAADPIVALDVIEQILNTDSSDEIVENLSAGPLEDLLAGHGRKIIDEVEERAKRSDKFRMLLGGVWQGQIDQDIWRRILAVRDREGWDE